MMEILRLTIHQAHPPLHHTHVEIALALQIFRLRHSEALAPQ